MAKRHSPEVKQKSLQLLLDGKSINEVAEVTGVNQNTLMSWRQQEKNEAGVEFPTHNKGRTEGPNFGTEILQGFNYSDEEILALTRQNPGFGIQRFCKELYPKTRKLSEIRFLVTMLLQEHLEVTGEDLFDLLQDPSFSRMVSANEYKNITGKSRLPQGHGRSTSRTSKVSEGFGKGSRKVGSEINIPLPPQEFNWGDIPNSEGRTHRRYEILE